MRGPVVFAVNGSPESAMGQRAQAFCQRIGPHWRPVLVHRPAGSILAAFPAMHAQIREAAPGAVYVLDMSAAGTMAALLSKALSRIPVVIDTGDAITELARNARLRGRAGIWATAALEWCGLHLPDHIVVRGSYHREFLAKQGVRSTWIPDGFEKELFYPPDRRAVNAAMHIGLLGSIVWNGSLEATYGWDLVELLAELRSENLRGIVVGDGSGLDRLRGHAARRGVEDRIDFAGRVPYAQLRPWIHRMDVCLSTQTNDLPGQVRTTGKLPLYLACGRFILASRAGEAARVLPDEMLVGYEGSRDLAYPAKLAAHLGRLLAAGYNFEEAGLSVGARTAPRFEYGRLAKDLEGVLEAL